MKTCRNLLSLVLLRAVQANSQDPDYPRDCLLLEAQAALRANLAELASFLNVRQHDLESWMGCGDSRLVPRYLMNEVNWLMCSAAQATAGAVLPNGEIELPEVRWRHSPRVYYDDEAFPGWLGIDVDPAEYNETMRKARDDDGAVGSSD